MPVLLVSYILNRRRRRKALSLWLAILPAMRSCMCSITVASLSLHPQPSVCHRQTQTAASRPKDICTLDLLVRTSAPMWASAAEPWPAHACRPVASNELRIQWTPNTWLMDQVSHFLGQLVGLTQSWPGTAAQLITMNGQPHSTSTSLHFLGSGALRAAAPDGRLVQLVEVSWLAGDLAAQGASQNLSPNEGGVEVMAVGGVEGVKAAVTQLQLACGRLGAGLLACSAAVDDAGLLRPQTGPDAVSDPE